MDNTSQLLSLSIFPIYFFIFFKLQLGVYKGSRPIQKKIKQAFEESSIKALLEPLVLARLIYLTTL